MTRIRYEFFPNWQFAYHIAELKKKKTLFIPTLKRTVCPQ